MSDYIVRRIEKIDKGWVNGKGEFSRYCNWNSKNLGILKCVEV